MEKSDQNGNSSFFVEFSLKILLDALNQLYSEIKNQPETPEVRLGLAKEEFKNEQFSRKDYILCFKSISSSTASRDLALGVSMGILSKSGTKAMTQYRFLANKGIRAK